MGGAGRGTPWSRASHAAASAAGRLAWCGSWRSAANVVPGALLMRRNRHGSRYAMGRAIVYLEPAPRPCRQRCLISRNATAPRSSRYDLPRTHSSRSSPAGPQRTTRYSTIHLRILRARDTSLTAPHAPARMPSASCTASSTAAAGGKRASRSASTVLAPALRLADHVETGGHPRALSAENRGRPRAPHTDGARLPQPATSARSCNLRTFGGDVLVPRGAVRARIRWCGARARVRGCGTRARSRGAWCLARAAWWYPAPVPPGLVQRYG